MKTTMIYLLIFSLFLSITSFAQRSDVELNRDSVVGWKYISNPINPRVVYKPIKSLYANGATYTVWQQQAADILINWIQQSYLPRGLAMRTLAKNGERWYVSEYGPLHSYGVNFLGYSSSFVKGKIDLHCCEQGQRLVAGFNDFPGVYIKGFNPGGVYLFAEQAQFSTGDDDDQLSKEEIDKRIQRNVYPYRTYLNHYHDNGKQLLKIGMVVAKNGEWPFKPVLVKDAIAFYQQQLAAYPDLLKYDHNYRIKEINASIDRLKPYYNEPAKILNKTILRDDKEHSAVSPVDIINGKNISRTFPEYFILVSATQQTIDQTRKDSPLWVYFNFTPAKMSFEGAIAKFDKNYGTRIEHMVYSLLNNLNFDYISKWLLQPDAMKNNAYKPANAPATTSGNKMIAPVIVSAIAVAKNKDPYTILYEDFEGYPNGELSAKKWHTAGNGFANASITDLSGQDGKWIAIPPKFTFYPDLKLPLPQNYTISYDLYFGKGITNKRVLHYFRIDAYDPNDKYPLPMNMLSAVDKGSDFGIAMSGETITESRFRNEKINEIYKNGSVPAFKEKDIAHVTISVNGSAISVSVNGKEVIKNDNALPAGKTFKRIGWYCNTPNILLSNIYVKGSIPVR